MEGISVDAGIPMRGPRNVSTLRYAFSAVERTDSSLPRAEKSAACGTLARGGASESGFEAGTRFGWALLAVALVGYLATFVWFYPQTHAIEDEVGFLNMALAFSRGALTAEGAGLSDLADFVSGPRGHVGWRNPGRPLVTAPFVWGGGYRASFLVGALIHAALVLAAASALRAMNRSPAWALLLLLHPTLLLYSRTVMADGLGALGVAAALALALRQRAFSAGLALGLGCAARYQLAVSVPFLALAIWRHEGHRQALRALVGAVIVGISLIAYNYYAVGRPLGTTSQGFFSFEFIPRNAWHYVRSLLLWWPGMVLAPLAWSIWRRRDIQGSIDLKRRGALLLALALPLPALLFGYYFFDEDPQRRWYVDSILGQRLLQPALPAWVLLYAAVLGGAWPEHRRAWLRAAAVLFAAGGLAAGFVLQAHHQRHLERYRKARDAVAELVPSDSLLLANRTLTKLFEVPRIGIGRPRLSLYQSEEVPLGNTSQLRGEDREWFLAHLSKAEGAALPAMFRRILARFPSARELYRDEHLTVYGIPPPLSVPSPTESSEAQER